MQKGACTFRLACERTEDGRIKKGCKKEKIPSCILSKSCTLGDKKVLLAKEKSSIFRASAT
jgi:hypothetical protein